MEVKMKLPEIFKNKLDDNINQSRKVYMGEIDNNPEELFRKFPVKVTMVTKNDEIVNSIIVGKTENYLITKNRNVIYLKDLKEIKKA